MDFSKCFPAAIQNMHVIPWRYQELEYLLAHNNLDVAGFSVDRRKPNFYFLYAVFLPIMFLQAKIKENKVKKKGGVDFQRMNKILLSSDMMLGRHIILEAVKK